jgi:LytS/YehU family sensor histidine kinase
VGIPAHIAAISLIVVAKYAALGQVRSWLRPEWREWDLDTMLAGNFISEWVAFGCVVAVVHALEFYQRYREREVQALRLQTQLAQARLESLTAQLHPHFLFNTLHGISTLMHRDVDAADLMLTRLSDLLRRALRNSDRHEVPLAEELDTLEQYLAIMRVRFEDRLTVTRRIAPNAAQALVPHFLLQPLAENALQHGIARRAGAGHVEIVVDRIGDELHIAVSDDGAGMRGASVAPVEGIGLSNTRRRLEELYGPAATLALEEPTGAGAGFRVRLVLPFRPSPASADAA